jgi:hypothetical protein
MNHKDSELYSTGLTPPKEPHLVVINAATREGFGIPVGSLMGIVMDAEAGDIQPVVLAHVQRKLLRFRCGCGDKRCTLVLTFRCGDRDTTGRHPRDVKQ